MGWARMLGGKEGSSACPDVTLVLPLLSALPAAPAAAAQGF